MTERINLGIYRSRGVRVFAGRERGGAVREAAGLDAIDVTDQKVIVHVPMDVFAISSSFFLGLFGPSIRALGREGFLSKYVFEGKPIRQLVLDGTKEALRTTSPL